MNHIPRIIVKVIDPANQRFGEVGDWFHDKEEDTVTVYVSRMVDWRSELAVAIHEVFESISCIAADIDQTDVDAFDKQFHLENDDGEPGDEKDAPYFKQHVGSTFIEKETIAQSGLAWLQHEENCNDA